MSILIGRRPEKQILQEALESPNAELVAMYGRRRIGKTFLIRTVFEKNLVFELTGLNGVSLTGQLQNFTETLTDAFQLPVEMAIPQNWIRAFRTLIRVLEPRLSEPEKKVVFLDELPWLDTPKSNFLAAFDHFWNSWASKQPNLVVVVCGSAASWMIQNIVRNTGGLHNRITKRIRLLPFDLYETEQFLLSQGVDMTRYQIAQTYMITGGIPHYLKELRRGESFVQGIDRICFSSDGLLRDEFKDLYAALFSAGGGHVQIVRALADKPGGMTRSEIATACNISSGGSLTKWLEELSESGFIAEYIPLQKAVNDGIFKLNDEFTLFYFKFLENNRSVGTGAWEKLSNLPVWRSWSALAFENLCLKHVPQIKKALGISGVYTEQSSWRWLPKSGETEEGAQIDLLLDRQDNCINLIEIKFSVAEYELDKATAESLERKRRVFLGKTATKKLVFTTLLTTFGAKKNAYLLQTVHNQVTLGELFQG
jgi:uncharacterized protein